MKDIIISENNNIIELQISNNKSLLKNEKVQNDFFEKFKNYAIKKILYYNKKDICIIIMRNGIRLFINNYNKIKKKNCFNNLNKRIKSYNFNKLISKLKNKRLIIAGSLSATAIIGFNVINSLDNTEEMIMDNNIFNNVAISLDIENIETEKEPLILDNEDIEIQKEPLILDNEDIEQTNEFDNNSKIDNSATNETIDFSVLKNFTTYKEYIEFAANLYGVDYNVALIEITKNFKNFTTPCDSNIGLFSTELNRMKDLKARGVIDGDLNIIGFFLTIKDYAIDHLNLTNQTPILSNKTVEEKEKDLIHIAKYVYGVNNQELLNCLLATHRLETGYGTSDAVLNKNNFGGNMSPSSTPGNLVLNVYKTAEIGEESMVRNFLNCYGKCFYNEECDQNASIPTFISKMYCYDTANDWAREITEIINYDNVEEDINNYLNDSKKTMY